MIGSIISDETDLCGTIVSEITTVGAITSTINLIGSMNVPIMAEYYEDYLGNYTVTPKISGQILPTQDKHMLDNLVIDPIPYYEVCNQHDGTTIIIGGND